MRPANQQQPAIKAHSALSSSSTPTVHNPQSPLSPSQSSSSSESMPFSSVSPVNSRNTPLPQIYTCQQSQIPQTIPLSRKSALLPIHSSTSSSSSHNVTIPVTSPQPITTPQFSSDCEKPTNAEPLSETNILTPKRTCK